MFDAILFDLDGTLLDTETVALRAGTGAFAALGQPVDMTFLHSLVGVDQPTSARIIAQAYPHISVRDLRHLWEEQFLSEIAIDLPMKAGATDLLAAAQVPLAVVTSSGREAAAHKLALAHIAHHFDFVISVDDVSRPKPAPEPYLLAAQRLGLPPARCLVFEDSETGAEAAHRAGCTVVQIPDVVPSLGRWAHHLADDLLSGARHFRVI